MPLQPPCGATVSRARRGQSRKKRRRKFHYNLFI